MKIKFGAQIEGWKNFTPTQFSVSGIQHHRSAAERFIDGCANAVDHGLEAQAVLERDRWNSADKNAIKVIGRWQKQGFFGLSEKSQEIGYIPAGIAADAAPLLDEGKLQARLMSVYRSRDDYLDVKLILVIPEDTPTS